MCCASRRQDDQNVVTKALVYQVEKPKREWCVVSVGGGWREADDDFFTVADDSMQRVILYLPLTAHALFQRCDKK